MGLFKKSAAATVTDTVQSGLVALKDGTIVHITKEVNAIGSTCPGPQLKTLRAMGEAVPGEVVSIRIDNPDSLETVVPMSGDLGATHLGTLNEGRSWRVLLQKNE